MINQNANLKNNNNNNNLDLSAYEKKINLNNDIKQMLKNDYKESDFNTSTDLKNNLYNYNKSFLTNVLPLSDYDTLTNLKTFIQSFNNNLYINDYNETFINNIKIILEARNKNYNQPLYKSFNTESNYIKTDQTKILKSGSVMASLTPYIVFGVDSNNNYNIILIILSGGDASLNLPYFTGVTKKIYFQLTEPDTYTYTAWASNYVKLYINETLKSDIEYSATSYKAYKIQSSDISKPLDFLNIFGFNDDIKNAIRSSAINSDLIQAFTTNTANIMLTPPENKKNYLENYIYNYLIYNINNNDLYNSLNNKLININQPYLSSCYTLTTQHYMNLMRLSPSQSSLLSYNNNISLVTNCAFISFFYDSQNANLISEIDFIIKDVATTSGTNYQLSTPYPTRTHFNNACLYQFNGVAIGYNNYIYFTFCNGSTFAFNVKYKTDYKEIHLFMKSNKGLLHTFATELLRSTTLNPIIQDYESINHETSAIPSEFFLIDVDEIFLKSRPNQIHELN